MSLEHATTPHAPARSKTTRYVLVAVAAVAVAGGVAYGVLHKSTPAFAEPPRDVPYMDGKWIRYSAAHGAVGAGATTDSLEASPAGPRGRRRTAMREG